MSYPGNASLSPEIQDRILSTFGQTLELASRGNRQEALLGCDFILRLDPAFAPARTLLGRLQVSSDSEPVEVADLGAIEPEGEEKERDTQVLESPDSRRAAAESAGRDQPTPLPPEYEAPQLGGPPPPGLAVAQEPSAADTAQRSALGAALGDLLERRELKRLVQVAEENRHEVAADPKLRKTVETAYSRLEADPYVESFLDSARQALEQGDPAEAERLIAKAQTLDPTHPSIAEVEESRGFYEDTAQWQSDEPAGDASDPDEPVLLLLEADDAVAPSDPAGDSELENLWPAPEEEAEPLWPAAGGTSPPPAGGGGKPPLLSWDAGGAGAAAAAAARAAADAVSRPKAEAPTRAATSGRAGAQGDDRIDQLLAEGQAAFDRGEYQEAIDSWSRIFLIDIDHQEAARRIDEARAHKAEGERRVEEIFHEAVGALDDGDTAAARGAFERVLELSPGHLTAREYLEQLTEGGVPPPPRKPPPPSAEPGVLTDEALLDKVMVPPTPTRQAAPVGAGTARVASPKRVGQRFLVIGGGVLLLVLLVGFFAWQQWDRLFPNSEVEAVATPAPDPILRAEELFEAGRTEAALGRLRRVPPDHPRYQEAQDLLGEWQASVEALAAADAKVGPDPEVLARRDELLDEARAAYAANEYLSALKSFEAAAGIAPLAGTAAELEQDTRRQLEPLAQTLDLFRQREWEFALKDLWPMHQQDPGNPDVVRLMVDSYYNLAVRDLQRGNPDEARAKLEEALALQPDSPLIERHQRFAEAYVKRPIDLLYRIYVKYLPFR